MQPFKTCYTCVFHDGLPRWPTSQKEQSLIQTPVCEARSVADQCLKTSQHCNDEKSLFSILLEMQNVSKSVVTRWLDNNVSMFPYLKSSEEDISQFYMIISLTV